MRFKIFLVGISEKENIYEIYQENKIIKLQHPELI